MRILYAACIVVLCAWPAHGSLLRLMQITDPGGDVADVGSAGGLDVSIQAQHTTIVDVYFHEHGGNVTISGTPAIGDRTVTLVAGHGVVVGDYLGFKEDGHFFEAEVVGVATNVITLDQPLDYTFTSAASPSHIHEPDMSVDGSSTTAVYHVTPPSDQSWDIVRMICVIEDGSSMDSTKFGGISGGLTNGVVLRMENGITKNIFNVKTNGEFALRAYDVGYDDRAGGSGNYAFRVRSTFGGQSKRGVTIRLDGATGDELQLLVQDDLTPLTNFRCTAQGHVVEPN